MPTREQLIQQYASLDLSLKKLEAERETLRQQIFEALVKEGTDKLESPVGTFTVAHKITWKYSPALTKKEEQLKIAKMREQDKGLATSTDKPYLLYHPPKV